MSMVGLQYVHFVVCILAVRMTLQKKIVKSLLLRREVNSDVGT